MIKVDHELEFLEINEEVGQASYYQFADSPWINLLMDEKQFKL